jgi:hypothetical protein
LRGGPAPALPCVHPVAGPVTNAAHGFQPDALEPWWLDGGRHSGTRVPSGTGWQYLRATLNMLQKSLLARQAEPRWGSHPHLVFASTHTQLGFLVVVRVRLPHVKLILRGPPLLRSQPDICPFCHSSASWLSVSCCRCLSLPAPLPTAAWCLPPPSAWCSAELFPLKKLPAPLSLLLPPPHVLKCCSKQSSTPHAPLACPCVPQGCLASGQSGCSAGGLHRAAQRQQR